MAVTSTTARTTVLITGLPQNIPIFQFNVAADLLVLDGGALNTGRDPATVLTFGSDYVTTGGGYDSNNNLQTGSVVISAGGAGAVIAGDYITIVRNLSLIQNQSFVSTGPRTPLLTEQDDDRLTEIAQELNDGITRSIRAPDQEDLDWVLPNADARIESFPFFDSNGDLTLYTLADILAAISSGTVTAAANTFYAGPTSGAAATPSFRAIVAGDLTGLTGFALAGPIGSSNLTMATGKLLGRTTGATGAIENITPNSTNFTFAAGALNTIQDITTTSSPTFKGVSSTRTDGSYGFTWNSASGSFGGAVSGTTFLFDSITGSKTVWAVDAGAVFYFSRLTTNGILRTSGANGAVSVISFGQIPGTTTNDNASAGNVGEYQSASRSTGSPISLTSNVGADITSVSLTAGDWDVEGNPYIALGATTTMTACNWWISTSSATYPGGTTQVSFYNFAIAAAAGQAFGYPTPTVRISLSGTTTVYFSIAATFATSTLTAAGSIRARRVR